MTEMMKVMKMVKKQMKVTMMTVCRGAGEGEDWAVVKKTPPRPPGLQPVESHSGWARACAARTDGQAGGGLHGVGWG